MVLRQDRGDRLVSVVWPMPSRLQAPGASRAAATRQARTKGDLRASPSASCLGRCPPVTSHLPSSAEPRSREPPPSCLCVWAGRSVTCLFPASGQLLPAAPAVGTPQLLVSWPPTWLCWSASLCSVWECTSRSVRAPGPALTSGASSPSGESCPQSLQHAVAREGLCQRPVLPGTSLSPRPPRARGWGSGGVCFPGVQRALEWKTGFLLSSVHCFHPSHFSCFLPVSMVGVSCGPAFSLRYSVSLSRFCFGTAFGLPFLVLCLELCISAYTALCLSWL